MWKKCEKMNLECRCDSAAPIGRCPEWSWRKRRGRPFSAEWRRRRRWRWPPADWGTAPGPMWCCWRTAPSACGSSSPPWPECVPISTRWRPAVPAAANSDLSKPLNNVTKSKFKKKKKEILPSNNHNEMERNGMKITVIIFSMVSFILGWKKGSGRQYPAKTWSILARQLW